MDDFGHILKSYIEIAVFLQNNIYLKRVIINISMKKVLLFLFFFGLTIGIATAQGDAKSKAIIQKAAKLYKSYATISCDFTITTKTAKAKPAVSVGKLWIKGTNFKLEYANQQIFCNGATIWAYSPSDEEVTIEDYKQKTNNIAPNEIFNLYSKGFKSNYEGPVPADNGKSMHDLILLIPKKKAKYAYIKVEIEQGSYKLKKVIQHFKNGTEVTIDVTKVVPNNKLEDSFFVWNQAAHAGVTPVDLRNKKAKAK